MTEAAQAAVNRLAELRQQLLSRPAMAGGAPSQLHPIPPPGAQLIFILDAASTKASGMLMVHAATRKRAADGKTPEGSADTIETPEGTVVVDHNWSAAKPLALTPADVVRVADKADRDLVALLTSAAQSAYYGGYQAYASYGESGPAGYATAVRRLSARAAAARSDTGSSRWPSRGRSTRRSSRRCANRAAPSSTRRTGRRRTTRSAGTRGRGRSGWRSCRIPRRLTRPTR